MVSEPPLPTLSDPVPVMPAMKALIPVTVTEPTLTLDAPYGDGCSAEESFGRADGGDATLGGGCDLQNGGSGGGSCRGDAAEAGGGSKRCRAGCATRGGRGGSSDADDGR